MKSYRITVGGRVQGVFYRKYVSEALNEAGYAGYVRNLKDGRVEVVVRVLNSDDLKTVQNILKTGSLSSIVENIIIETLENDDIDNNSFTIRY